MNKRYNFILHALILISILDFSGIVVSDMTVRVGWLFAPLLILFVKPKSITTAEACFLSLFTSFHLISCLYNSHYSGLVYVVWIVFNYLVFYRIAASSGIALNVDISKVFIQSGRIQILFGAFLVFISQHERITFTYYEPSYMAIGLIPYITFSLLNRKVLKFDMFCIFLFLALGQSALFILFVVLIISGKLWAERKTSKPFFVLILIAFSGAVFFIDAYNNEQRANHLFVATIVDQGFSLLTFLDRAGNRFPRMAAAFEVLTHNFYFGIGSGNYPRFVSNLDFTHLDRGLPWLSVENQPPINIFLEAGINAGIFGALVIFIVFVRFAFLAFPRSNDWRYFFVVSLTFIAGLVEANYLRAYCWIYFGIIAGHVRFGINRLPGDIAFQNKKLPGTSRFQSG
jgi:hypothetical protein